MQFGSGVRYKNRLARLNYVEVAQFSLLAVFRYVARAVFVLISLRVKFGAGHRNVSTVEHLCSSSLVDVNQITLNVILCRETA
jgi:hypothetical protein